MATEINERVPQSGASTCYCSRLYDETGGNLATVNQTFELTLADGTEESG